MQTNLLLIFGQPLFRYLTRENLNLYLEKSGEKVNFSVGTLFRSEEMLQHILLVGHLCS